MGARLLAEQLYQLAPSEEHRNVLAQCMLRCSQKEEAARLLTGSVSSDNRYLLATVLVDLCRWEEAHQALLFLAGAEEPARDDETAGPFQTDSQSLASTLGTLQPEVTDVEQIPGGAAGAYLLGIIAQRCGRREAAIRYFTLALASDPFLYCAYQALCGLGVPP